MATQPQDRDSKNSSATSGPPGKVVPEAIGDVSKTAPAGEDGEEEVTTPAEAFGDAQHATAKAASSGGSPQVPGKAVPDALSNTGKR
jgi:hypothetical protein